MKNYWDLNFKVLASKKPDIAALLERVEIPDHYEIVEAKNGSPALVSTQGKRHFISSAYNPQKQAKNQIKMYKIEDRGDIILCGDSLGFLTQAIHEKINFRHRFFIIIHDPALLKLTMTYNNMSKLIYDDLVRWVVGDLYADVFMNFIEAKLCENLLLIHNKPVEELDPAFYINLVDNTQKIFSTRVTEFNTLHKAGRLFRENLLRNMKFLPQFPHAQELKGLLKDRPAVLVAAGPSLDKNIQVLKENQDKVFVICVSTILNKILDYGIKPDMVATFDMGTASCKYLEDAPSGIPLVADMEANHEILPKYDGPVFLWPPEKPVTRWIEKFHDNFSIMAKGASVSHLIFHMAELMECSPLIMVGMDLAYTDDKAHADGSNAAWGGDGSHARNANVKIKSWDGKGNIKSDSGFLTFITLFEKKIREFNGKVVDATEGGAYKAGAENITLQEAIDTYCSSEFDVQADLNNIYTNAPRLKKDLFKEQLEEFAKNTNELMSMCDLSKDSSQVVIKAAKNRRDMKRLNKNMQEAEKHYLDLGKYEDPRDISSMGCIKVRLAFLSFVMEDYEGHDKYLEVSKLYKYNAVTLKEELADIKAIVESILEQI